VKRCLAAALTLAAPGAFADTAPGRTEFAWMQPVDGTLESGRLYRVRVPDAAFDGCLQRPERDLRVFDADDRPLPFFVHTPPPQRPAWTALPSRPMNRSVLEAPSRGARIDAELPPDAGGRDGHEAVRIVTRDEGEWIRKVETLGSDDGQTWSLLSAGYIVRHRQPVRVDNDLVRHPRSNFRRVQVRIHPDPRIPNDPVAVDRVEVLQSSVPPARLDPVGLVPVVVSAKDAPPGWQTVAFDTGARARPVDAFTVSGVGDYVRPVAIFSRNAPTGRWQRVGSGQIQQIGDSRQDRLVVDAAARFWRIDIHQGDDPPLGDLRVSASARPRWIVFEARSAGPARLLYGAAETPAPSHDLARRTAAPDIREAPVLTVAARTPNPSHRPAGPGERLRRTLVTIGVGLASLIVLVVIVRMLRDAAGPEPV
jgi:hypothetical protein